MLGLPFREVWFLDFEYLFKEGAQSGTQTTPICVVARELCSGKLIRMWLYGSKPAPPFEISDDVLFVTYFATAELTSFLALGWPLPAYVIDLYAEFRLVTNEFNQRLDTPEQERRSKQRHRLLDALKWAGIPSITSEQKTAERELIRRGPPWTDGEQLRILDYCQTDVDCLGALLERLLLHIRAFPNGLSQALLRGRYTRSMAHAEHDGLPVDLEMHQRLRHYWEPMKSTLVRDVDRVFKVYDGTTLKHDRLNCYLYENGIEWPRTETGRLKTDKKTWEEAAQTYPQLAPLALLHYMLNDLKLEQLAIGPDGRNRALLGPFGTATGRNAPKASQYLFNQSKWLRPLIRPEEGRALAYMDWSSHEMAVAGALSGDAALLDAVSTGDPYMQFLRMAGMVSRDAARADHEELRALAKTCFLAQNGQGTLGLARRTGMSYLEADDLRRRIARMFPRFTAWSEHMVDVAQLRGYLTTEFGWRVHVHADDREPSLKNFMVQAGGAEMFRIGCCLGSERGVSIVAPVHDAVMIEGSAATIEDIVATMRAAMDEASKTVLSGYVVDVEEKIVRWPERYIDPDGLPMWNRVQRILAKLERDGAPATAT